MKPYWICVRLHSVPVSLELRITECLKWLYSDGEVVGKVLKKQQHAPHTFSLNSYLEYV